MHHIGQRRLGIAQDGRQRPEGRARTSASASATGKARSSPRCRPATAPIPKAPGCARPRRAGSPPKCDRDHPVDALAHQPPEKAVKTEWNCDQRQQTGRHHPGRHDRHGEEIGDHAIGREAMEMVGRERAWWRDRRPGCKDQARPASRPPQSAIRAARDVSGRRKTTAIRVRRPRPSASVAANDIWKLGCTTASRRNQQHRERRDRDGAQRQRRPVEHHADQHDRGHDEGALGRNFRAGQQQIEGRHQRAPRAPPIS